MISVLSNNSLVIDQWNLLYISLIYSNQSEITIYINNILDTKFTIANAIFVNVFNNTSITLGGSPSGHFTGFVYSLKFDTGGIPTITRMLSSCVVPINGYCLPICSVNTYWLGPSFSDCSPCLAKCKTCIAGNSCSLCNDNLCYSCIDYSSTGCTKCTAHAVGITQCKCSPPSLLDSINSLCVICTSSQYYNGTTCVDCPSLCATCNSNTCLTCVDNASLTNKLCNCNLGYFGTTYCDYSTLYANMTISSANDISLRFSEDLRNNLQSSDISITACIPMTFTMEKLSNAEYYISTLFTETVPGSCTTTLTFLIPDNIISIENGIIENITLSGFLYKGVTELAVKTSKVTAAATTSAAVTTTTIVTTTSVSIMNPNPACLWSFINTIQMLCFIDMSNIPLPPKFEGTLQGLKKYNMFPNFFSYFVPSNGGDVPYKKAYDFGYKTNLLLLNSGNYMSLFLCMMIFFFIVLALSKFTHVKPFSIPFIKKQIDNTLANYKYGAFIRFWITCYLEIFAAAIIAVLTTTNYTVELGINFTVAAILIVIFK